MKAVILAAGRGSRLAPLTDELPKALLPLSEGETILDYIIVSLPQTISQTIVVVGHMGGLIRRHLGASSTTSEMVLIEQGDITGTWGALWSARESLVDSEPFLVVNGDDLYDPTELAAFAAVGPNTMGVTTCCMPPAYHAMDIQNNHIAGFRPQTAAEQECGAPICTGAYVLEPGIFEAEPVCVGGTEYGLPQTLMQYAVQPQAFTFSRWQPINTPCDLDKAKTFVVAQK